MIQHDKKIEDFLLVIIAIPDDSDVNTKKT